MGILDLFRLDGKVALVTGGNRNIGRSLTLALAEAGADVVNLSRGSDPGPIRGEVEALGRRFFHIQCDLNDASVEQLHQVVDQVVAQMGRLDILVNNAGIIRRVPVVEFNETDWDEVLQVNLKAVFFLSQAAAKIMLKQGGGKIVHIGSVLTFQGGILIPSYAASKHGLAGITKSMANEWAAKNINVNAIAPGYIATKINASLREDENRNREIVARIPAGDWGSPDDLKGAVVFLASRASDYMHGAIMPVDGGWLSR